MNSGVYAIKCHSNNKYYVGSSKNIKQRWANHRSMLERGTHVNVDMQNDYDKFGSSQFEYILLVECSEAEARKKEAEFIKIFNCEEAGYNVPKDKFRKHVEKKHMRFNDLVKALVSKTEYEDDGNFYYFDFFEFAERINYKPSQLFHTLGADSSKTQVSFTKTKDFSVGYIAAGNELFVCVSSVQANSDSKAFFLDTPNVDVHRELQFQPSIA